MAKIRRGFIAPGTAFAVPSKAVCNYMPQEVARSVTSSSETPVASSSHLDQLRATQGATAIQRPKPRSVVGTVLEAAGRSHHRIRPQLTTGIDFFYAFQPNPDFDASAAY